MKNNSTQHTPGPWVAPEEQFNLVLPKSNWESNQIGAIKQGLQIRISGPTDAEVVRANAILIACAPELLAELMSTVKAIESMYSSPEGAPEWLRLIAQRSLVAIRKATGGGDI